MASMERQGEIQAVPCNDIFPYRADAHFYEQLDDERLRSFRTQTTSDEAGEPRLRLNARGDM
jgi:hypothetical protein